MIFEVKYQAVVGHNEALVGILAFVDEYKAFGVVNSACIQGTVADTLETHVAMDKLVHSYNLDMEKRKYDMVSNQCS